LLNEKIKVMKKLISFTVVFILTINLYSEKVGIEIAKTIAKNHYVLQCEQINGVTSKTPSILETFVLEKENDSVVYIFNFENGFTLVSADDAVIPILGFSLDGKYNEENRPPAFIDLIEYYKNQISYAIINKYKGNEEILLLWSFYSEPENLKGNDCEIWPKYFIVNPLLSTRWNQNCYYNDKCPYDIHSPYGYCYHVPNGCVAVAMSQVMKSWDYPSHGTGSHGYEDGATYPEAYGYQFANFANTTYEWDEMPDILTGDGSIGKFKSSQNQIDAVSTLIYHCGVSVNMDYGYNGSGAQGSVIDYALINYFNYSPSATYKDKNDYNDSEWESMLTSNLGVHQPIIYAGYGTGGHAFVLDGFTKMQTECCTYFASFHVNWGWGGNYNGYFYLADLTPGNSNFTIDQSAVLNIIPPNPTYTAPPQPSYISEPACYPHCTDENVDYFVPHINEATSYEWDISGIYAAGVTWNGRYASVWSHHYGEATLWCRALNHSVPGPWKTRTIYIENCSKSPDPIENKTIFNKSEEHNAKEEGNEQLGAALIFPNPANNILYISIPASDSYSIIELINNKGEVVKSIRSNSGNVVIDTKDITAGLYAVKIYSVNKVQFEKVIIIK